jgi:hypothetical protein
VDERQSFLQDDDDDTLLFKRLEEDVLEKYPNPERIGCIDQTTLEKWVYSPQELDLSDPKYLHVLKCAECTRELVELRKRRNEQRVQVGVPRLRPETNRRTDWRWTGIAAILVCGATVAGVTYWRVHSPTPPSQMVSATPVAETVDLSQAGTTRGGGASAVPPVVLPRRLVVAHIFLPYFSPGGKYVVSVTMGKDSSSAKAEGLGTANVSGFRTDLTVSLDLRNLPQGTYYLATTHEGDRASYYYPLTVR